jgi:hypothetical protein
MADAAQSSPLLPGRDCGSCTMCCKVLAIEALGKPMGKWCAQCAIGSGCRIYAERPRECRDYYCAYLTWPDVADYWWPSKSKMVLDVDPSGEWLRAHVDPARADAWKAEPYLSQLKRWASGADGGPGQVLVLIDTRAIVILPDRVIDLGVVGPDETIVTEQRPTTRGTVIVHAYKTKKS